MTLIAIQFNKPKTIVIYVSCLFDSNISDESSGLWPMSF